MQEEVKFGLPGLETAVRKMIGKRDGMLTAKDVEKIKYLRIEVPYDVLQLSIWKVPLPFEGDGGDEWYSCCAFKHEINDFVDNHYRFLSRDEALFPKFDYGAIEGFDKTIVEFNEQGISKEEHIRAKEEQSKLNDFYMKRARECCVKLQDEFRNSGKELTPETRRILEFQAMNEMDALRKKEQPAKEEVEYVGFYDWIEENPGKFEEDLKCLTGLVVLRICEAKIENFEFLKDLKNLKVLELAQMRCPEPELMKEVSENLEQLCIWVN